jgi:CubicO group peptidase (beta-lactamase class C family)
MTGASRMPALDAELAALVQHPAQPLASLSVLAVRDAKPVYQAQFGDRWMDPKDPKNHLPANAQTLYRIASLSKLVTTLGVMRLVEQGTLQLDADVSGYLGYRLRNPHFPDTAITLRMLLSHTSSLRDDAGYYWEDRLKVDLREVLTPGGRLYGSGAMWSEKARPGGYFSYANLPWGVIGSIMEAVTGERFDRLMQRLILDPMGLHGGFHPTDFSAADLGNVATLYRKRSEVGAKEIWDSAGPWVAQVDDYHDSAPAPRAGPDYVPGSNGTLFGPQGNCRLSAEGLGRIMRLLLNQGRHEGRQLLTSDNVATMLAPQWQYNGQAGVHSNGDSNHGQFQAWGLGLQLFRDVSKNARGDRLVEGGGFSGAGHFGDAWGLTALLAFDPATRNGMVYLSGGPGFNPETSPGAYSSTFRYEEQIRTALYRHALRGTRAAASVKP